MMACALIEAYYSEMAGRVVFDTSRRSCSLLPLVAQLLPDARVICCVRSPSWIIDSVERTIQRNSLVASRMFGHEVGNVYKWTEKMIKETMLGPSMSSLRQAWFSEYASRLIAVRYDSLAKDPARALNASYRELDEPLFPHDFDRAEYDTAAFDTCIGMPGFHRIRISSISTTANSGSRLTRIYGASRYSD
jgi:sulfotransferase